MEKPTLQTIRDRALVLFKENCKEYPYRAAFEFATEQVFNELNIGKYARTVLRAAISKTFGPNYFQESDSNNTELERCVRTLYQYGVDIDDGLTEALRQYRVDYFPNRIAFRNQIGKFVGHSGIKRAQALAQQRKTQTQKPSEPSHPSLFSGNRLQ